MLGACFIENVFFFNLHLPQPPVSLKVTLSAESLGQVHHMIRKTPVLSQRRRWKENSVNISVNKFVMEPQPKLKSCCCQIAVHKEASIMEDAFFY